MSAQPTVTITRVESWLKSEGVGYEVASDGNLLTGFDSCTVSYVDECNSTMYAPRATMGSFDDGVTRLQADVTAFTAEGMSEAQLHGFLDTAFSALLGFYEAVAEDFPSLVTWKGGS